LAELFAYEGFAAAISGDFDLTRELGSRALHTSRTIEPNVVANLALALASPEESPDSQASASQAVSRAAAASHVDLLVWPLRIAPRLLRLVNASPAASTRTVRAAIAAAQGARTDPSVASLSRREQEVLSLIAEGLSNRQIAARLYISDVTVKVHVRHIFEKLGVRTRTEAALIAVEDPRYAAGASNSASRA
jgi:DNA-binding NarL/FixJ family response regulator